MIEEIKRQCVESIVRFEDRVLPVEPVEHGILVSEGFAFCAMCDLLGVNLILESGVGNGGSTLMWAKYFGDRFLIKAMDIKPPSEKLREKLKSYTVDLQCADSVRRIPKYIKKYWAFKIAVFIDGPKREAGIKLAKKSYAAKNVVLVAVHDLHSLEVEGNRVRLGVKTNASRDIFNMWAVPKFCSDADWFVQKYGYLDKCIEDDSYWRPYKYKNHPVHGSINLGSYGFTVGMAYKEMLNVG